MGKSKRIDQGEEGRFRCFTRKEIKARGDNLDISWLQDESNGNGEKLPEPDVLAAEIMELLRIAMEEMEELSEILNNGTEIE